MYMEKAKEIVSKMTLEEKASLCSGADTWHTQNIERLSLPSIMVSDGPHGLRKQFETNDNLGIGESVKATCFPTASLSACCFDRELLYEMGQAIADECIQENVSVILGPGINMKRSPLCGRNFEYFTEDPYASGELASAFVNGVQSKGIGTSLKHFAVNNQERRRMNVSAEIDERTFREVYLRAFEKVIKQASPYTVMCSYNQINNCYSSENSYLLTDILRKEWGYNGLVVSDWGAVNDRVSGIISGLDLEMPGNGGINDKKIVEAVKCGKLSEDKLDITCVNVVNLVLKCSLHNVEACNDNKENLLKRNNDIALKIAQESMVLLKNDDCILPIDVNANESIAVIGAMAKQPRYQGAGSSKINPYRISIPFDELADCGMNVKYEDGYTLNDDSNVDLELIDKAVELAKNSDKVIIFAGLPDSYETEGIDRKSMKMPENQVNLINHLSQVNSNIIVVLMCGAPVEIPFNDNVKAILLAYLGGQASGRAISSIITGKTVPSGRLAETWPIKYEDCLSAYNFPGDRLTVKYKEGIFTGYRYFSTVNKPVRYPYGHGLSYSSFNYSGLVCDNNEIIINDECDYSNSLNISFKIKNTGKYDAKDTVFVFISHKNGRVADAKYRLVGFVKKQISVNEEITVETGIKYEDLAYYDVNLKKFVIDSGEYELFIGKSINDLILSARFTVVNMYDKLSAITVNMDNVYYEIASGNDIDSIPDGDFEQILNRPVSPDAPIPARPFTMDNCLEDTTCTLLGRILLKAATKFMLSESSKETGQDQMMIAVIREMPFHSLWVSSNGIIKENMMYAVLEMLNGHFIRGIVRLTKK